MLYFPYAHIYILYILSNIIYFIKQTSEVRETFLGMNYYIDYNVIILIYVVPSTHIHNLILKNMTT